MKETYTFDEFMEVIRTLRGKNGCPWDREQTHETLKHCLLEECYETIEAVNQRDPYNLAEELGDVLLLIAMNAVIAEEEQTFSIEDIITNICKKMIHRHPHVFGNTSVKSAAEVLNNWEEIKKEEKKEHTHSDSMIRVARALPANIRAQKVQKKAARVGFDFPNYEEAYNKVYEELEELKQSKEKGNFYQMEEKFGNFMFSVINLSRFLQLNAENSLTNATDKFINRFVQVETLIKKEGRDLKNMSIEELNILWTQVK